MKQKIELEKKIKRQLDKNWEDERDLRVKNWRKYSNKIERKQKRQQEDNNKHHPHHHHHHHWGKFQKRKKRKMF